MRRVLHLVRRARHGARASADAPAGASPAPLSERTAALVAAPHWIVDLRSGAPLLLPHGSPPLPAGPITFDELHQLIRAAELIVTW